MTLTQPIKWHGGKHYLAEWIISHFPKHIHYVEPYFGGGSVLLSRSGEGVSEVINDIHSDLIRFWRVLSGKETLADFLAELDKINFSQEIFESSRDLLKAKLLDGMTEARRAAYFFVVARQSRQGLMKDFATLSRNRTRRGMNEQVSSWLTAVDGLPDIHARLRRVVILNQPALEVISSQDSPNTLFYLDPPYLHQTRVTTKDYAHEMTTKDHERLLQRLATIQGKFILSGYPADLYNTYADKHKWHVDQKQIDNKASSASEKELKTECLWMNFDWRAR